MNPIKQRKTAYCHPGDFKLYMVKLAPLRKKENHMVLKFVFPQPAYSSDKLIYAISF